MGSRVPIQVDHDATASGRHRIPPIFPGFGAWNLELLGTPPIYVHISAMSFCAVAERELVNESLFLDLLPGTTSASPACGCGLRVSTICPFLPVRVLCSQTDSSR
jgi:hypothetical protein